MLSVFLLCYSAIFECVEEIKFYVVVGIVSNVSSLTKNDGVLISFSCDFWFFLGFLA